jgi:hypothetical protein
MKMTRETYEALKADVHAVASHCAFRIRPDTSIATLWLILHEINAQRSYGDDHPRWQTRPRFLPPSHVNGQTWLNEVLYGKEGLYDDHIKTALTQILKDVEAEEKKSTKSS